MSDATKDSGEKCPKSHIITLWEHGPAEEPHPCPFQSDVHDDSESLCTCCTRCSQECADDI